MHKLNPRTAALLSAFGWAVGYLLAGKTLAALLPAAPGGAARFFRVCLLAPLVEQDLPHTLLLRNFERVVMGERKPEGAASTSQNAVPCEDEEPDAQGV